MSRNILLIRRFLKMNRTILGRGCIQFQPVCETNIKKNLHTQGPLRVKDEDPADINMTKKLDKEEEILNNILDAALEEVFTHGWSMAAVKAAVQRLGYPAVTAGLIDSPDQLVMHHIKSSNKKLDAWMETEVANLTQGGQRLPIFKFVRSCIVQRLSMNIPLLQAGLWTEGVARVCQSPSGVCQGVEAWQEVCDDIWWRAGDNSHDMSWYTKRMSLAAVMTSTDIFMIQDSSENYRETWAFLDRRLDDLKMIPQIKAIPGDAIKVAEGLFQTAKILVGAQK